MRRRRILVARGICGAHGGHETAEVRGLRVSGWGGCLFVDLSAFGINADYRTTEPRTKGNDTRRRNKGRNILWRN